jgi:hypothetical protein
VRLSIVTAATRDKVLVVPLAAVAAGADGQTVVMKLTVDGHEQRIAVTTGLSGDGFVEVTPVGGALAAGDLVVVGKRTAGG